MNDDDDTRTLAQLAKEALQVQDACNLSGVVLGWARAMRRLNQLLPNLGTDARNHHPVNVLWASKCADLTGCESYSRLDGAMTVCAQLEAGFVPTPDPSQQATS